MKKLKFLTPYLLTPEAYRRFYFDKPCEVYISDERDGEYEITVYNKTHTKIIDKCAWFRSGDFEEYSPDRLKKLQEEFEEDSEDEE